MNSMTGRISIFILAVAALVFALSNIYTTANDAQGTIWILNKMTGNVYKYEEQQRGFAGYNVLPRNRFSRILPKF